MNSQKILTYVSQNIEESTINVSLYLETQGMVSLLVSYPFDTIKVMQQTYHISLIAAIKDVYKFQGFRGYYSGILSPLFTYGPSNSLFFGVYGKCIRLMEQSNVITHQISPTDYAAVNRVLVSGTVAGVFQTIFYSPIEYVKILIQVNNEANNLCYKKYIPPYKNTYDAVVGIYRTNGILGYYRGFWPTLARDGPSGGVYMLVYEMLRYTTFEGISSSGQILKEIVAGGTAGLVSIATMIPIDVVKTHIQTDDPKKPHFKGFLDCFVKLYASDGIRIFFKGLPVVCYRSFPAHAVMFVGYEFVMQIF